MAAGQAQDAQVAAADLPPQPEGGRFTYARVAGIGIGFAGLGQGLQANGKTGEHDDARGTSNEGSVEAPEKSPEEADTVEKAPPMPEATFIPLMASRELAEESRPVDQREAAKDDGEANASTSEDDDNDMVSLPWEQACRRIYSPMLRLHQEVLHFSNFLKPTVEERAIREEAIERIRGVILAAWPHAKVEVFGSFATGLYLPTSDVDMVVLDSGCTDVGAGLRLLANKVSRKRMATNILVLAKARVPIVKFKDVESSLNFDISFDIDGGPQAAKYIQRKIAQHPQMRPLIMILKIFLQQRELNEVYSGGIGSYALITMVHIFLMTHHSRYMGTSALEESLGILLVDFFDFYGNVLNMTEVGVSCDRGGSFYDKHEHRMFDRDRPYLLSIKDPRNPESDIGKNSYNIQKVRSAFQFAHTLLSSPEDNFGEMLLMRIIRLDEVLIKRLKLVSKAAHARSNAQHPLTLGRNQKFQHKALPQQHIIPDPAEQMGTSARSRSEMPEKRDKMKLMGVVEVSSDESSEEEGALVLSSQSSTSQESEPEEGSLPSEPRWKRRKGNKGRGKQADTVVSNGQRKRKR